MLLFFCAKAGLCKSLVEHPLGNLSKTSQRPSCRKLGFPARMEKLAMISSIYSAFLDANNRIVLVCSARSGNTKETGTTNLLIQASLQALRPAPVTSSSSPNGSQAVTPSTHAPYTNPLLLTSQVFQRSSSSTIIPTLSNSYSRANSPVPSSPRRSLSNSTSSLREEIQATQQLFEITVEQIRNDHLKAARTVIRNQDILDVLEEDIDYDCDQLQSFLMAAQVFKSVPTT